MKKTKCLTLDNKKKLNKAFRELRKKGYFAGQNFGCCQTCGWDEIPEEYRAGGKVVFYHMQDTEGLIMESNAYISWIGDGKEIVKTFIDCGVPAFWNGKENTRILVDFNRKV